MKSWLLLCFMMVALHSPGKAAEPRLTKLRALRLADAAAKHGGYDLRRFDRPIPHFSSTVYGRYWIVFYTGKPDEHGMNFLGNNFSVRLEDRDGHASVSAGR